MTADDHLRSLDGLRAMSIVLVLVGHLNGTRGFGTVDLGIGDYAHLGVQVFFVISGFLITSLLLREHARTTRVSLGLFYARRALRIFPAAFAYLACVVALWLVQIVHLEPRDLWHAVTYTVNFQTDRPWLTGHLWSLSVEEQFYLLWPAAFAIARPSRAPWVAVGVIAVSPMMRAANWYFLRHTPYYDLEMFPLVADSLAVGCLLATLRPWLESQRWYLALLRPASSAALLAVSLALNRLMVYSVVSAVGTSVVNVCLGVLIHRSVYHSDGAVGRFLNWRPVAFVGVLSYSLYLWQQLFLDRSTDAWATAWPMNLVFAVAAALASYYLLERPLMGLRHRLRI